MALDIGTRLGPYEITGKLGAGGMGQVFKARDTRLNRTVAIKVSGEAFTARFEREARAVAALSHPNICQLYDVGPNYLVLEYVAGAPVMPTANARKLLDLAVQIADAMAAAHDAGFVHRDLKPSNVLVTAEGRVKILDFGLAKAVAPRAETGDGSALTVTTHGLVAGTAAYMSPEQARGDANLDARSDQFSYGLVLYEMATRKRPFDRGTAVETLAAIVRDDPEPLPTTIPAPLRWIIARCIEKEPRDRYASSRDLYLELKRVQAHLADASIIERSVALVGAPRRTWRGAATFAAGAVLTVVLVFALGLRAPRAGPDLRFTPLATGLGQGDAVWSPNGREVAYAARQQPTGLYRVYARALDAPVARPITSGQRDATPVQWTTDDRIILRTADNALWSILPVGGEPEPLVALTGRILAVAVSRDGSSIAYLERGEDDVIGIRVRSPPDAEPRRYEPAPFEAQNLVNVPRLHFSPDGRQLLLMWTTVGDEAWLMPYPADPENPPRRILEPLPASFSFSWLPENRIVLSASREPTQPAHLLVANPRAGEIRTLWRGLTPTLLPAASPDGSKLVFHELIIDYDIVNLSLTDAVVTPLLATGRSEAMPAWAAERPAMVYVTDRNGSSEIWLHEPGEEERPLVTAADFDDATLGFSMPSLSPEADRVIYARNGGTPSTARLYVSAVAGGSPALLVDEVGSGAYGGSWSPDGNWFVYTGGQPLALKKVRTSAQAKPQPLKARTSGSRAVPTWSPRGDWIMYNEGTVRLISPGGDEHRDLGFLGLCAFAPEGDHLYCVTGWGGGARPHLLDVDFEGNQREIGTFANEHAPDGIMSPALRLTPTPDGKSLTYTVLRSAANLWLLEGLDTVPLP